LEKVATPGRRTIEEVSSFLKVPPTALGKTLIYIADGKLVAVMVRGDHMVNELKLKKVLGAGELYTAADADVEKATSAPLGFAGPIGLELPIYADLELQSLANFVVGANQADAHWKNVNVGRDFQVTTFADLRTAAPGDPCPRCEGGVYKGYRGIEVGHVFYLGTNYSTPMRCTLLDKS